MRTSFVVAGGLAGLLVAAPPSAAQEGDVTVAEGEPVKASHETLDDPSQHVDEYGITVPVPASHPGRRFPAEEGFPTGPSVGERLPDFRLPNQEGETIDFHRHRGERRAAVMFQRSAVW